MWAGSVQSALTTASNSAPCCRLHVPPDHLIFLDSPGGGLLHLFLEHYAQPYASHYTRATRMPSAQVRPGLGRVRPDLVPSPNARRAPLKALTVPA